MPFRISSSMKDWFVDIWPPNQLELQFDAYYLCLIAGLVSDRQDDTPDATDLVNDFPGEYRALGKVIVSLFLSHVLENLGVALSEKETLYRELSKYLDATSADHLTEDGLREMNRYAFGGIAFLREAFDDRPRSLAQFLVSYHQLITQTIIDRQQIPHNSS